MLLADALTPDILMLLPVMIMPLLLLVAFKAALARAEEREADVVVRVPVAEEEPAPLAVEAAPAAVDAQVAAVGRLETPWPAQRESAKLIVAVQTQSAGQTARVIVSYAWLLYLPS